MSWFSENRNFQHWHFSNCFFAFRIKLYSTHCCFFSFLQNPLFVKLWASTFQPWVSSEYQEYHGNQMSYFLRSSNANVNNKHPTTIYYDPIDVPSQRMAFKVFQFKEMDENHVSIEFNVCKYMWMILLKVYH